MSVTVSVVEAKTHLSRLLDRVQAGDAIIIERRGEPAALLSAPPTVHIPQFGFIPGEINDGEALAPLGEDELKLWGIEK